VIAGRITRKVVPMRRSNFFSAARPNIQRNYQLGDIRRGARYLMKRRISVAKTERAIDVTIGK
jgi:hypothetical protein